MTSVLLLLAAAVPSGVAAGAPVPDATLRDAGGFVLRLRGVLPRGEPAVLVVGRHRCTAGCSLLLRDLARALAGRAEPGVRVAVVSPDASENPMDARRRQAEFLDVLGGGGPAPSPGPFLVGGAGELAALVAWLGFPGGDGGREADPHPAGLFAFDARGRLVARLGPGAGADAVARAVDDARAGRAGDTATPATECREGAALARWWPPMQTAVRVWSLAIAAALGVLLARLWRAERRRADRPPAEAAR